MGRDFFAEEYNGCFDDVPLLGDAKGVFHPFLPVVGINKLLVVVFGMRFVEQFEMDPSFVATALFPDLFAMDGGGIGTGIDLHIDVPEFEFRKIGSVAPTNDYFV